MKKNYIESDFFLCDCNSPEHQIVFQISDWTEGMSPQELAEWPIEERQDMHIFFFLDQYRGFFKRLWVAIKYLCKYKCRYGHFDSILLGPEDAERMVQGLQKYLGLVAKWKKV